MKIKIVLLVFLLSNYPDSSLAQETRLKYIGIEAGTTFITSEISEIDYIRSSTSSYYMMTYSANSITSSSFKNSTGVKFEIMSLNDRFGLLGGIRFSHINSSIGKIGYWTKNTDYFYWLYRQDGINTEYLRINEINQNSDYIGIPIEVRYLTGKRPRKFQFYLKSGIELNYLLKSRTNILFYSSAMEPYEKDVIPMLNEPKRFSAAIYGGAGFRFGRDQKPSLSVEASMPYIFLSSRSCGIVKPLLGGGFQLNFQIPVKTMAR